MPAISVFIITLNEEKNVGRCLESVRWADEIVVADSGSHDATERICRKFTDKFFVRPFKDYADQKNHALSLTTGDWVLSIDADEEVTPGLKAELQRILAHPEMDAYRLPRRSRIFGRWMRFTGTQYDRPVRLWKKGKARFEQPIHEIVHVDGQTGCLKNPLLHYTYDSLKDYMERLNRYTTAEAAHMRRRRELPSVWEMGLKPPTMFLKRYWLESGFRDGMQGFLFSALSAFYLFLKMAKCRETQ